MMFFAVMLNITSLLVLIAVFTAWAHDSQWYWRWLMRRNHKRALADMRAALIERARRKR